MSRSRFGSARISPSATWAPSWSFDMVQPGGRLLSAGDIKVRTATVLKDRFARILGVDEAWA
jgi:hypothetical protein